MSDQSPQSAIWDALRGGLVTRALGLVAELRIARALEAGPRPVSELAAETGADADTLHRLLRALASDGIFAEEEPGVFRNTEASELLATDGWDDFAHLFGGIWLRAVLALDTSGTASFPRVFGAEFWKWLAAHPEDRASFDRAMAQGWQRRLERLESVGWRGDETVVDVGGGNGSLLFAFLERHPEMRGIVFDLPETVRDDSAFGDRCTFVEGSFFERVPEGDAHVLSTIIHDWDDEPAGRILRTVRREGRAAGAARRRHRARQRARRVEVAGPAHADTRGRARADRGAVAKAAVRLRFRADPVRSRRDRGGARDLSAAVDVPEPEARSELCRDVLAALPGWFGIQDAVDRYIQEVAGLPTFAAGRDGFLSLKLHGDAAAEIYVMGVRPERQRRGIGTALLEAAEAFLREREVEYLQVKTLGPSHPSEHYAATRSFYAARGFRPLEELTAIWGEDNPCLIMVKRL